MTSPDSPRIAALGARWPRAGRGLVFGACVALLVAACGAGGGASPNQASVASAGSSAGATPAEDYQLLMDFYAAEAGPEIDPMTFITAPGAPAAVGPLSVRHAAGVATAKQADPPTTPLLGADGS